MASLSHENWDQVEEHEGVLYIRAILNRGIGDCTVRHGSVLHTYQQELRAFQRGCNAQCDYVLKSITPYVLDAKVYFIYNNYSFTLNEINNLEDRKIVSNGKLTDSFLNLMRNILLALEDMHWGKNLIHCNIAARNIVVIATGAEFCVKYTGLGDDTVRGDRARFYWSSKVRDCYALAGVLTTIVHDSLIPAPLPPLFTAVMVQLRNLGCRHLSNSFFFLQPSERLKYLVIAHRLVQKESYSDIRVFKRFLRRYLPIGSNRWIVQARNNPQLFEVLKYPTEMEYDNMDALSFLRFCRNAIMHYPNTAEGQKTSFEVQWEALYQISPDFFHNLHEYLCRAGIIVVE